MGERTGPDVEVPPGSVEEDELSSQDTQLEGGAIAPEWLPLPFTLGRYVITERLGRGGAGAVFRAHDPELARDVAIKVVRARSDSDRARERLLGEAQAIAKLSHPNVVAVHDVGELPKQAGGHPGVYMVMELLDGATLRQWLRAAPRSLAEILDVLLAAGRGLDAAHRAGLVHRDFKPDNLLIGDDGTAHGLRVHVLDFGLALAATGSPSTEDPVAESSTSIEIAGTPGYMAPEQHLGEPNDARTDLFAFCVTAWEAVHGAAPYRGRTLADLERAKRAGPPAAPNRRAPYWLQRVLARGLAPDPGDRHASMSALLDAIARRRHLRRNIAIGTLAAGLAGGAFALAVSRGADAHECIEQGEQRLATTWSDDVRAEASARFEAAGLPYAADAWTRAAAVIDERVTGWRAARKESCEAALEGGAAALEQSAAVLGCLDDYLDELDARVGLLAVADRDIVLRAARMAERMAAPERCLDAAWVARERGGGDGGSELEAQLLQARLQHELGHYDASATLARATAQAAEDAGDYRRRARALLQVCRGEKGAKKGGSAPASCTEAWIAGERAGSSTASISAMLELLGQAGAEDEAQAELLEQLIRARMAAQAPEDTEPGLASELALVVAQRHRERGRWQDARVEAQRAYELMVEHRSADDPAVVSSLNELALSAEELGELGRARELFEQGLAIMVAARGRNHPDVVSLENNIAGLEIALGRHDDAQRRLAQVRAAKQAIDGVRTPWQLTTMYQQVESLVAVERGAEALTIAREALALAEEAHGDRSTELLAQLVALAWALRATGGCDEALRVLTRLDAIAARTPTRDPEIDAQVELERARCSAVVGRQAEAGQGYARAVERFEQLYGARGRPVAEALLARAQWEREHGLPALAVASLERARDICGASEGDPALDQAIADELARHAHDRG